MKKVKPFRGERMKQARVAAGFSSARAFARHHHLNEITYSQHEQGRRNASVDDLEQYAKLLKVSPAWLSHEQVKDRNPPVAPSQIWSFTLPVVGTIKKGKLLKRAELKPKVSGKVRLPFDPRTANDQQFVYRLVDFVNGTTPLPGLAYAICSPFNRADVKLHTHVITAVRRDNKYTIVVGEVVSLRPEYLTLNIGTGEITATPALRERYLGTILARVLAIHRPL
jgi:transcriptional regulator with XRE-family HTH domain